MPKYKTLNYIGAAIGIAGLRLEFQHLAMTEGLRYLGTTSCWSLRDLLWYKINYNLTDFGVEEAINFCAPRAIPISTYLELLTVSNKTLNSTPKNQ